MLVKFYRDVIFRRLGCLNTFEPSSTLTSQISYRTIVSVLIKLNVMTLFACLYISLNMIGWDRLNICSKEFTSSSQPHPKTPQNIVTYCFALCQNPGRTLQICANTQPLSSLSGSSHTNRPAFIFLIGNKHCQFYLYNSQPGIKGKYIAGLGEIVRVFNET